MLSANFTFSESGAGYNEQVYSDAGYSELAQDPAVAKALAALEGSIKEPVQPELAKPLVHLLDKCVYTAPEPQVPPLHPRDLLLLINRGLELNCLGDAEQAMASCLEVGQSLHSLVEPPELGITFLVLHARSELRHRDPMRAYAIAHRALDLAREHSLPVLEAGALLVAARGLMSLSSFAGARVYLEGALKAAEQAQHSEMVFEVALQQSALALITGYPKRSLDFAEKAAQAALKAIDPSVDLRLEAMRALEQKEPEGETGYLARLKRAREYFARAGDPVTYLTQLDRLADVFTAREEWSVAAEISEEILSRAPAMRQYSSWTRALHRMGLVAIHRGQFYLALGYLERAEELADQHQVADIAIRSRLNLGRSQVLLAAGLLRTQHRSRAGQALMHQGLKYIVLAAGMAQEAEGRKWQLRAELRLVEVLLTLAPLAPEVNDAMRNALGGLLRTQHPVRSKLLDPGDTPVLAWAQQALPQLWRDYTVAEQEHSAPLYHELLAIISAAEDG